MAYKGDDIDLRTPPPYAMPGHAAPPTGEAATGAGWWTRALEPDQARQTPIWVDELVLECCNQAYELAVAHRAAEVRLSHLLHAMTLIDAASRQLEARAIRVSTLRRDSASVIASEVPRPANGKASPRKSDELGETLRIAAERAYRRQSPATVNDILDILFDMKRDLSSRSLLTRHGADWNLRNTADPAPASRSIQAEPAFTADEAARGDRGHVYYPPEGSRAPRGDQNVTDSLQISRLDALERMMRELTKEITIERQAFAGMMSELQRDLSTGRTDATRFHGGLSERIAQLEQAVMRGRGPGPVNDEIVEHIDHVERSVDAKFTELARGWSLLGQRLEALEEAVATQPGGEGGLLPETLIGQLQESISKSRTVEVDLAPLLAQLKDIESRTGDASLLVEALSERFDKLEEALPGRAEGVDEGLAERIAKAFEQRMTRLETLVAERLQPIVATVSEAKALDRQRSEAVARMEARDVEMAKGLDEMARRLAAFESTLAKLASHAATLNEGQRGDLTEVHEALVKLNANQQTLAQSLDQWRLDSTGDLSVLSNRIADVERVSHRPLQLLETLSQRVGAIHQSLTTRTERRSAFWFWLFGTDDWYGASYGEKPTKPAANKT